MAALVLGPFEADSATKECGGKQGTIHSCDAWCLKIIFTLLTKVIIIYVRFSGIDIWGPDLEWALL